MIGGEKRLGSQYRLSTGHLLILGAAIMWSTSGLFAKSPVFSEWPVMGPRLAIRGPLLAFWRALFACLILLPLVRRPRWTPKLIPAVLFFALMNFTFLTALTTTTAANAIWLQYTAPVWVFLVGAFFLHEPVQRRDWVMLGFALAGIGLILAFEGRGQTWDGVVYGLSAGLCYAGVVLTLRWLRDEDAAWLVALNHCVTAALFFPFVVVTEIWPTYQQFSYLAGFGVLQMGIPYLLFARGLRTVSSHEASLVVLLEPLLVPLWVFLAWRSQPDYQPPAVWTWGGGLLILFGLLARYVPSVAAASRRVH